MKQRLACWLGCLLVAAMAAGCGGGSSVRMLPVAQLAQAEPAGPFNVQAAFNNSLTDTTTLSFKVEGQSNGLPVAGEGAWEQGTLETVSEFGGQGGALRKLTPTRMTLTVGGRELRVDSLGQDFFSRMELRPLGRLAPAPGGEFTEITQWRGLPYDARVGDHGLLYTGVRYSDAARREATGTSEASYSIEPDQGDDSALLVLRVTDQRADGRAPLVTTTVLRITRAGTAQRVSETTADPASNTTLTARFL